MAGLDTPQNGWDSDSSLSHLWMFAGLGTAFGMFVLIAAFREGDSASQPTPEAQTPAAESAPSVPGESKTEAFETTRIIPEIAAPIRPAIIAKRRPKALKADAVQAPLVTPAMAEKPPTSAEMLDAWADALPDGQPLTEAELKSHLALSVPSMGLNKVEARVIRDAFRPPQSPSRRKRLNQPEDLVLTMLGEARVQGLPFSDSADCQLERAEALSLEKISLSLHTKISLAEDSTRRRNRNSELSDRGEAVAYVLSKGRNLQTEEAIPALVQILQVEPARVRKQLIEILAEHQTPEATRALVARAVFDLSPEVRDTAALALAERYHAGYRRELLEAFGYPWSPAAWHAAETLVTVNDKESVPALIELLDAPDPAKPHPDPAGNMMVQELVRIHHVQNCLLCHPPSQDQNDRVLGLVPDPFDPCPPRRLPTRRSQPAYYASIIPQPEELRVRADVTYLRQDFSVIHDDGDRFDYLVRTREATPAEIAAQKAMPSETRLQFPQRQAILFALRKLTGQNRGPRSEDWQQLEL